MLLLSVFGSISVGIVGFLILLLRIYSWVIFGYLLLSWIIGRDSTFMQFLAFLCEPVLGIFRPLAMKLMQRSSIPLDLSPLFAFISISILTELLYLLGGAL